jgi:hypothetical protein
MLGAEGASCKRAKLVQHPGLMRASLATLVLTGLLFSLGGCGPSTYGFSRTYQPLGEERPFLEQASEASYEEVRRARPEAQRMVGWFGVVLEAPQIAADGSTRLVLGLHAHQERHLCQGPNDDSCKVTVSEREIGRFTARVTLRPDDRAGPKRVWVGSLVKIYGTASSTDGELGPDLVAAWYRHWPPNYYVTTESAHYMRR